MSLNESKPKTRLCDPNRGVDKKYEPLAKMSSLLRPSAVQTPQNVSDHHRAPPARLLSIRRVPSMRSVDLAPVAHKLEGTFETKRLDEELRGQHAAVGDGIQPLRQPARPEAPQIHRQVLIEAVVDLRAIVVVVVDLEPVDLVQGVGAFDFVALLLLPELVRHRRCRSASGPATRRASGPT